MIHSLINVERHLLFLPMFLLLCLSCARGEAEGIQIVAFGTSFTAGKGLWASDAFPAKLEQMLRSDGEDVQVINQGVSGNTTLNLLGRVTKSVPEGTQIVIFEYSRGNDERWGISKDETVNNAEKIISQLLARNIQVLLVIIGRDQAELQKRIHWFSKIIYKYDIPFLPIELPESSLQADRLHPNAEKHGLIAASMVSPIKKLIARVKSEGQLKSNIQ